MIVPADALMLCTSIGILGLHLLVCTSILPLKLDLQIKTQKLSTSLYVSLKQSMDISPPKKSPTTFAQNTPNKTKGALQDRLSLLLLAPEAIADQNFQYCFQL